jgi:hypothetical protein
MELDGDGSEATISLGDEGAGELGEGGATALERSDRMGGEGTENASEAKLEDDEDELEVADAGLTRLY